MLQSGWNKHTLSCIPLGLTPAAVSQNVALLERNLGVRLFARSTRGLIPVPHAAPHLESGALVRLLPNWYGDVGAISLYFTSQKLLPAKTRAFVDFVVEAFRVQKLPQILSAKLRAIDIKQLS